LVCLIGTSKTGRSRRRRRRILAAVPRLVLVHDRIGGSTGMGQVAAFVAQTALDAGWRVRLVTSDVAADIGERCEVTKVPRPARPPQARQDLVWYARVIRGLRRDPEELIHVHAPALLRVADVMTSHHLALCAHQHGVRASGTGIRGIGRRLHMGALIASDELFYRTRVRRTRMTFVSEFLREQFRVRYGDPTDGTIIAPPSPPWRPAAAKERLAARARYGVGGAGLVVGYLGGDDRRKGVQTVQQLEGEEGIELLIGGPGSDRLDWRTAINVGFVDVDTFLPACDVIVAPALFDAAPTAVIQSLARGIPVVVGPSSGWAEPIARAGAGVVWEARVPLVHAVREAARVPADACRSITETYSAARQSSRLLGVYERVLSLRGKRRLDCSGV
jgi:glycosyltransferase involved in cell wall biosynthesis